ncbi:hypothetical protein CN878_16885 [Ochrobactrum sp. 695/2009]|nr:hypothetical protein CN881_19400 [Ochrobactrum sp. 721/2009]PJT16709.1 hypothetical protein CN880_10265 [Ochrobactrum sp. 720/2009]PJT26531.1 hypothetical protein CN879_06230 [Ochrobactrum sp. 715/2009]PJT28653.1 hypothetical protein CN878_16885 [Ochrobactrum sp. 695/2009]PJT36051.1 hypothetical protein CN877_08675 [Ochrobactrum sp. 689/2009]
MTTVPEEAVKAMPERIYAAKKTEGSNCVVSFDTPSLDYNVEYVRADLALPHLPGVGVKADTIKLIEQMAFGYEVMFEKLCHISGTSGADQSWYRSKAREATERLSPLHSITTESNKSVPGDCKRQYQDFMSRILSAIEPAPSPRALALEEIISELVDAQHKCFEWTGSAFLADELDAIEDAECKAAIYKDLCALGNTMSWLQDQVRALSSPYHADAGKVEGDGAKWPIREVVAKAIAYHAVGDPHARTIRGDQRWEWFTEEADKFISVFGYYLPYAPSQEVAGS